MNTSNWRDYSCEDYLSSQLAQTGYWDEENQIWCVEPLDLAEENVQFSFLQVGRPGVDGIGFGYRKKHSGFWAWYPMEERFRYLAPTIQEFLDKWKSGDIGV